ncbi:hypothetical protein F4861DRAFT_81465 [Xylaria intraflava]|nr:hypothetical protein F4861DRAFT_81465 [Xylaria intraflava]
MAEPIAASSPVRCSEEPMAVKAAQPENPGTAPAPAPATQETGDAGSHGSRVVQDAANSDDQASQSRSGAGGSTARDTPALDDAGEPTADVVTGEDIAGSAGPRPKAKKARKKRTAKSRKNITGFEEYYADPPMTPAEALEEEKKYSPSRPFSDRIEECIQRFRSRRRLDEQRTTMFNKYLFLGGIDSSPRQFTGMVHDQDAMAEADNEQIRAMTAVDFVGGSGGRFYEAGDLENWEIDFQAIVKGFLSRTIPDWYMYDAEANKMAASLIKNFLNYILMHDVCPEYTDQILEARHICDVAPIELRYMHELCAELPGVFNSAASLLFYDQKVNHLDQEENHKAFVQFRLTVLLWGLTEKAKRAAEKILNMGDPTTIQIVSTTEETYEVLEVERPRPKKKQSVGEQLATLYPGYEIKPAGFIRVAPAIIAHGWGNMPRPEEVDFSDAECEEFILEDELLAKIEVGMKIHMTVCQLNVGLHFIKEVHDVRVSFDTFLPQYLMASWKVPAINNRPPPSIHSPNSEETIMSAEMQVD